MIQKLFSLPVLFIFCCTVTCFSQKEGMTGYVSFEEFGAKGNGTDETPAIQKAFEFAKQHKLPVKLQGKTYIFSPVATVNITGIPAITGNGTLDVSKTGKAAGNPRMLAVFHVEGKKKRVQQNTGQVVQGSVNLFMQKNLSLKKGDLLFLASAEKLASHKRDYYCKGQRCIIKDYDPATGKLTVQEPFFYTINTTCAWVLEYEPEIRVEKNIRFLTAPMNFITCFRLYYAKGIMSGYYKNFALTAIMFKSSAGEVNEMEADLPVDDNNGYSHCIEVADMSSVTIKNCRLTGGRHVISGVGGGLWEQEECGGRGHAGYPSVLEINGGTYRGMLRANNITEHNATLDSHGLVERMTIKNCTIYGGINLGANHVTADNVTIYTDSKRILNVGSDVDADADWGDYIIKNSRFTGDGRSTISFIYGKANIRSLTLENIEVDGLPAKTYLFDFRYFAPHKLNIAGVIIKNKPQQLLMITKNKNGIQISDSDINMQDIKFSD